MSNDDNPLRGEQTAPTVRLRYEQTSALYASQFIVNANQEDVVINFSSGYISDPASGENTLPVHTRIAMSPTGVSRLIETLAKALRSIEGAAQMRAQTVDGAATLKQ